MFDTNTIGITEEVVTIDDIIEATNHFKCIDFIIDKAKAKLAQSYIKGLHFMLKSSTLDSRKDWFRVWEYKMLPSEVGG